MSKENAEIRLEPAKPLCQCDEEGQCEPCRSVTYADYDFQYLQHEYKKEIIKISNEKMQREHAILIHLFKDLGVLKVEQENTMESEDTCAE